MSVNKSFHVFASLFVIQLFVCLYIKSHFILADSYYKAQPRNYLQPSFTLHLSSTTGCHSRCQHCYHSPVSVGWGPAVGWEKYPAGSAHRPVADPGHPTVPSSPEHKNGQPQCEQGGVYQNIPLPNQLFDDGTEFGCCDSYRDERAWCWSYMCSFILMGYSWNSGIGEILLMTCVVFDRSSITNNWELKLHEMSSGMWFTCWSTSC